MAKRLIFTRPASLVGLADRKDIDQRLKDVDEFLDGARVVPETPHRVANALLTDRAHELSFSTRRPYKECQMEMLRRYPHLRLAVAPYAVDKDFGAITFIEEDEA